ncbi:MAG: ribonuclease J, partial [Clostridia bacterium]
MNQNLRLNFLGGVEEIGKNCLAIECGQDIIVVDVGMTFPTDEMPGIDVVIPDTTFLRENKDRIRGIFLTHGHEDHIGGMPYLLEDVKVPVYGTKLTLMLLENKLKEKNIKAQLKTVKAGSVIKAGCFSVELIHVNHSIEGAVSLSITTPFGVIFHTGDFKIDYTPVDGVMTDLKRISEIGKKGVLLLLAESTNIESPGYTMSEKTVGKTFDDIFGENIKKRIIIATFASNIHRVQQIIDTAIQYKRKVAFSGRSMLNIVDAARKIGALHIDDDIILDVEKLSNIQDKDLVIVSTGTQGEPMSALRRMAEGDFNKVKIGKNDTIVISATPIPGNEKMSYSVINKLYKLGADVIYSRLRDVHVSGHACQEELKLIHSLIKPKYFIPVHGEYR